MMKPVVEGRARQALELQAGDEVLEIGTGSGFLAACLGRLARDVVSIERHADFVDLARARLQAQGVANVAVEVADAMTWNTDRRFDAICVTGAVAAVPSRFLQWLRPGGRMFVVRGNPPVMDAALLHQDRSEEHTSELQSLMRISYAVFCLKKKTERTRLQH